MAEKKGGFHWGRKRPTDRIFGAIFVPLVFMRWTGWTRTPLFSSIVVRDKTSKNRATTWFGTTRGLGSLDHHLERVFKNHDRFHLFLVMFRKWTYRKPSHGDMVWKICLRLGCASLGILAHLIRGWLRSTITSSVRYLGSIIILRRWTRSPNS